MTLAWNADCDYDLIVEASDRSDHDECPYSGIGTSEESGFHVYDAGFYEGWLVENIAWNTTALPDGTYDVFIVNYNQTVECFGADYRIYIQNRGVMTGLYEGFAPKNESDCVAEDINFDCYAYVVNCDHGFELATSFVVGNGAEGSGTEESGIDRSGSIENLLDEVVVSLLAD